MLITSLPYPEPVHRSRETVFGSSFPVQLSCLKRYQFSNGVVLDLDRKYSASVITNSVIFLHILYMKFSTGIYGRQKKTTASKYAPSADL
jgi:hypothetical protein